MSFTPVQERFIYWIKERYAIRKRRMAGIPPPWTTDPILNNFHFCNVNREHDRVTLWINREVRPLLEDAPLHEAIFQLYVCRVFNEPEVLAEIMPVVGLERMLRKLKHRKAMGKKILRGAYLVVPHGTRMPVEDFYRDVAEVVRTLRYPTPCPLLSIVADKLRSVKGISDFMANQVCADLRYTPGHDEWVDWSTFVLAGPGTLRGLARWGGVTIPPRGANGPKLPSIADPGATLRAIREQVVPELPAHIARQLQDPNNLSNCFCEFDKYERARSGHASLRNFRPKP